MKQKIKFVKHFMSVVVAAVMVFATVAGIGNFFPNISVILNPVDLVPIIQDIQDCLLMEKREM